LQDPSSSIPATASGCPTREQDTSDQVISRDKLLPAAPDRHRAITAAAITHARQTHKGGQ
jgi:hypothetical protein